MILTARVPDKVTFLVTHRCNQSCDFCFDASNVLAAGPATDMSAETFDRALSLVSRSARDIPTFNITLSGGEPTLHRDFLRMVEQISKAGVSVTILSNGQAFADRRLMAEVLKFNVWNFQFSIEGASAEVHDRRVGSKGAWHKLLRAIENAKSLGARYVTNTTMTRSCIDEMFRVIDLLDQLQVPKMNIGNTLPECAGRNHVAMMEYPEVVEIAEQLTLYALTKRIAFSFITPLPLCLKENRVISNPSVCSAGQYSTVIDVDGRCKPCSVCDPSTGCPGIGKLATFADAGTALEEVVNNAVRDDIPGECNACSKRSACRAACPLYWKVPGVTTPRAWKAAENPARQGGLPSATQA